MYLYINESIILYYFSFNGGCNMEENNIQEQKVNVIETENTNEQQVNINNNSEAYLNALRKLEQEKEEAKKEKKKKRIKIILIILGVYIAIFYVIPAIFGIISSIEPTPKSAINSYILDKGNRTDSLANLVDDYIKSDTHSEEKEIKNIFDFGKKAIQMKDFDSASYLFKVCVDSSDEYDKKIQKVIDKINIDGFSNEELISYASLIKFGEENGIEISEETSVVFLERARSAVESGDYEIAIQLYSAYTGKENIENELREVKYNLAISYVEKEEYLDAGDYLEELGDYKYSKELHMWSRVKSNMNFDASYSARKDLKARLKDPSSYEEYGAYYWNTYYIGKVNAGNLTVEITRYVTLSYSATNSFGGRVSDTYEWSTDGPSFAAKGFEKEELEELLEMSKSEVIEKAKNFK